MSEEKNSEIIISCEVNPNKEKFFSMLENLYIGEIANKITGKSGFINIMNIKSKYFSAIKPNIEKKISILFSDLEREESYLKLLDFFSSYINETGTPFFKDTAYYKNKYVKLYSNQDTELFWKTKDLYYVKSEIIHESMFNIKLNDFIFDFDAANIEHAKNNEKKTLGFKIQKVINNHVTIELFYTAGNSKESKIENLLESFKKNHNLLIDKEILVTALNIYKKRNETDYFIHKDSKNFLLEQLHLYVYEYMFNSNELKNIYSAERIKFIQNFKQLSIEIIDYISSFENELKAMWEKPKLVKEINYVITIDRINLSLLETILKSDFSSQIEEWKKLDFINENFNVSDIFDSTNKLNEKFKYLPLDTKHLSFELKYALLESIEDLDLNCDGVLIHSDNWQALNTIKNKYNKKIDFCYIDPPFNTGSDFIYKDGYQDTTWLTLMENRLSIAKQFLSEEGSFYLHLDENANYFGRILLNKVFDEISNELIWNKGFRGTESKNIYQHSHDTIFYVKNDSLKSIWNNPAQPYKDVKLGRYNKIDENGKVFALVKRTRTNGEVYYGKVYPKESGKSANDVISHIPTMASTNSQRIDEAITQKPEELLNFLINASTNNNSIVFDFFSGSGTTINTAHKLKKKWIGVEMGEHFNLINLPRLKETLSGTKKGISELAKWKGGGFFKYYELEQYEETLLKASYSTKQESIDFSLNEKLLNDILVKDVTANNVYIDFTKLYKTINTAEIAETISNISGMNIKKISKNKIIFIDNFSNNLITLDTTKISIYDERFNNYIKKLLWWETTSQGEI